MPEFERWIADIRGAAPGPTLLVTGGLHGNEPAGVHAVRRVAGTLKRLQPDLCGRFIALCGNTAALRKNVRYVDHDLNRRWTPEAIERLASADEAALACEDREQRELLSIQQAAIDESGGPVVFLDLHSTSGHAAPFACLGDTPANRQLIGKLPIAAIMGLDEVIGGAMLAYRARQGHAAIAVEGGQHGHPDTVARLVQVTWMCVAATGLLPTGAIPGYRELRDRLAAAAGNSPDLLRVFHREVVAEGSDFAMQPGFESFEPVCRGQLLAHHNGREVRSPADGLLLMPRYQSQGEDGFFLARPVLRG